MFRLNLTRASLFILTTVFHKLIVSGWKAVRVRVSLHTLMLMAEAVKFEKRQALMQKEMKFSPEMHH